jgi:hypothetical protein
MLRSWLVEQEGYSEKFQGLVKIGNGLGMLSLQGVDTASPVKGFRVLGVDGQGLVDFGQSLLIFGMLCQEQSLLFMSCLSLLDFRLGVQRSRSSEIMTLTLPSSFNPEQVFLLVA